MSDLCARRSLRPWGRPHLSESIKVKPPPIPAPVGQTSIWRVHYRPARQATFQLPPRPWIHPHRLPLLGHKFPEALLADSGYFSKENVEAVQAAGSEPFIAVSREKKADAAVASTDSAAATEAGAVRAEWLKVF